MEITPTMSNGGVIISRNVAKPDCRTRYVTKSRNNTIGITVILNRVMNVASIPIKANNIHFFVSGEKKNKQHKKKPNSCCTYQFSR